MHDRLGDKDKLFTLTLDNASNNTSACEHLYVRCSAHILNILVQDGMTLIHPAIEKIRELLKDIDSSVSSSKHSTQLQLGWMVYWYNESNPWRKKKEIAFNIALVIATFLDPRRKLGYLKFFYKKVWNDAKKVDKLVKYALEWIEKYFTDYEDCVVLTPVANEVSSNAESPCPRKRKLEEKFAEYMTQERFDQAHKYEIDVYLEENLEKGSDNWDILAWWKCKSNKYPVLSTMARDFLAIPLSTVSSESAFSCGGRILGGHRSSLTPQKLEALICAKDWLFITQDLDVEGKESTNIFGTKDSKKNFPEERLVEMYFWRKENMNSELWEFFLRRLLAHSCGLEEQIRSRKGVKELDWRNKSGDKSGAEKE
ncbi:hypothetical protein U9M48_030402 [Paspalum notatum var. saurae]|uniref:Transposase n=1 Tax=Paspalum notatum var. saurae TaxID=547442 RepID=A0AAQ3X222_PASNO